MFRHSVVRIQPALQPRSEHLPISLRNRSAARNLIPAPTCFPSASSSMRWPPASAPLPGSTTTVIREAVLRAPTVPLRDLTPDVPLELERISSKALVKDRDQRWQTAREIAEELRRRRLRLHLQHWLPAAFGPKPAFFDGTTRSFSPSLRYSSPPSPRLPGSTTAPLESPASPRKTRSSLPTSPTTPATPFSTVA